MADQQKVAYGLSNGAIFNDLERPCSISATRRVFWPKALAAGQRAWPADLPFFDGCLDSIAQFASETSSSEEI